jgi:site-specific recombinase XerD
VANDDDSARAELDPPQGAIVLHAGGAALPPSLLRYLEAGIARNTRRALESDWRDVLAWAELERIASLPLAPVDCARYLDRLVERGLTAATIDRHAATIATVHRLAGLPSPTGSELVRDVRRGIKRLLGEGCGKKPLTLGVLLTLLESIPEDEEGRRDRALLLVGWVGGFRRSELVSLSWGELEATDRGYRVRLRRSKTDQEGRGQYVPLHRRSGRWCPCRALDELRRDRRTVDEQPIFVRLRDRQQLRPQAVWRVLRARLGAIGIDPAEYGAHSLRSGLVCSARERGASETAIMAVTRHRSLAGLLPYLARADTFTQDPAGIAGLV